MSLPSLSGPFAPPASGTTRQVIVLLHGYGSNGDDLFGLVPALQPHFPDACFFSPNAPFPCPMNPYGGYEWFDLSNHDPEAMYAGAQTAAPRLGRFLDEQLAKYNIGSDKLALVGFSQGTMVALHVALRRPKPIAGVVGFSGALLGQALPEEIRSAPPICLIHGDADPVVPFYAMRAAEEALRANEVSVEAHRRTGLPHSIDEEGLEIAVRFLKKCFT